MRSATSHQKGGSHGKEQIMRKKRADVGGGGVSRKLGGEARGSTAVGKRVYRVNFEGRKTQQSPSPGKAKRLHQKG